MHPVCLVASSAYTPSILPCGRSSRWVDAHDTCRYDRVGATNPPQCYYLARVTGTVKWIREGNVKLCPEEASIVKVADCDCWRGHVSSYLQAPMHMARAAPLLKRAVRLP